MDFNEFTVPSTPVRRKRRHGSNSAETKESASVQGSAAAQAAPVLTSVPQRAAIQEPETASSQWIVKETEAGVDISCFGKNDLVRGIIFSEILGKPKARRRFGR